MNFPWKTLADKGFGLWWSDTTAVTVPPDFNSIQALRIIGYDIKDSPAAIQAFKRKYQQVDSSSKAIAVRKINFPFIAGCER